MRAASLLTLVCACVLVAVASGRAAAHFLDEHADFTAAGSNTHDPSVALDDAGDRLVLGAPGAVPRTVGATRGQVTILVRSGASWSTEAALDGNTASSDAFSGASVAIDGAGDRVAAGGPGGAGHVRVFVRSGSAWSEETTLRPSEASGGFGKRVALSNDGSLLAVGWSTVQRVDVYTRTGSSWSLGATLTPSVSSLEFGHALAVSNDGSRIFVGAAFPQRVFDFTFDGVDWNETAIVRPVSRRIDFGQSLAVDGTNSRLVVGARGSVTQFDWDGAAWIESEVLAGDDGFGAAVALSADGMQLAVGAPEVVPTGRVFTYVRSGDAWIDDGRPVGGIRVDPMGASVAFARVSVDWLLAGGVREADDGSGGAMLFGRVGHECTDAGPCPTGHCTEGVCCTDACGEACETCLPTGSLPGACGTFSLADAVVCFPDTGPCHPAVTCRPFRRTCPPDAFAPAGTVCRDAAGACDRDEVCDGSTDVCPADVWFPAASVCRPATGTCDAEELCDGVAVDCPVDDVRATGEVCRASTGGVCDVEEVCDGVSTTCPDDVPMCIDAGPRDAGVSDAGASDAAVDDAGSSDAGSVDAGMDAGSSDAGSGDAGLGDAGFGDASVDDAGAATDAGADAWRTEGDAGHVDGPTAGCGCRTGSGASLGWFALLLGVLARRRR